MKNALLILTTLTLLLPFLQAEEQSEWNGYRRLDFSFGDRPAILVFPDKAITDEEGKHPWIWRARFFGHEPQLDLALLERGFHLAYADVSNLFGAPQAVDHWDAFHVHVTETRNLSDRVVLEGMSRGGLIIYNWAAQNPEKVICIYADAPVLDIRSWPGGKGSSAGSAKAWETCLKAWNLTESDLDVFTGNPLDQLKPLADANVPLLHVVGDADEVVPVSENTVILERRYLAMGGRIEVMHKPGVGHHPHSLEDPEPILNFILREADLLEFQKD